MQKTIPLSIVITKAITDEELAFNKRMLNQKKEIRSGIWKTGWKIIKKKKWKNGKT